LSQANLLDLLPARFPKLRRTGNFWPAERSRKRLGKRFYQEIATANNENGNCPANGVGPIGSYRGEDTIPDVGMVGETEESLKKKGVAYIVGRANYRENARGWIIGDLDASSCSRIVSLPAFTDELFPQDIASMLKSRLTFKEAIESPDHSLMSRHRLKVAQREFYSRLDSLAV